MRKFSLPREFSFIVGEQTVTVILTKHLFRRREYKGVLEKHVRIADFKATWQLEDAITAALFTYGLAEFANCGRSVFVFDSHKGERLAMLLEIRKDESKQYVVTIITIDKITKRHYTQHDIFMKERQKVYSDYSLKKSYTKEIAEPVAASKNFTLYKTKHFKDVEKIYSFIDDVDVNRLANSLFLRIEKGLLAFGICWVHFDIADKNPVYLKLSIEKHGSKKIGIIFADVKRSRKRAEAASEKFNHKFIELVPHLKSVGFKKVVPTGSQTRSGLKIKKKSQKKQTGN